MTGLLVVSPESVAPHFDVGCGYHIDVGSFWPKKSNPTSKESVWSNSQRVITSSEGCTSSETSSREKRGTWRPECTRVIKRCSLAPWGLTGTAFPPRSRVRKCWRGYRYVEGGVRKRTKDGKAVTQAGLSGCADERQGVCLICVRIPHRRVSGLAAPPDQSVCTTQ